MPLVQQGGRKVVDGVHVGRQGGVGQFFAVHQLQHAAVYGAGLLFILKTSGADVTAVTTGHHNIEVVALLLPAQDVDARLGDVMTDFSLPVPPLMSITCMG